MQIINRILNFSALTTQIYTLMKLHYSFWSMALILISPLSLAQIRSGQVTDENNLPLPGATVVVQGTSRGTTTDFDGNYQIEAQSGDVLLFSYVGYADQQMTVGAADRYNVQMQSDTELEEVIITGYSSQKKSEVTGSAVQLNQDQLSELTLPTVDQALQGRVSGLIISTNSGTPGSTSQIRIRGVSSITAGNEPLYVIDGVPITNNNISSSTASSFFSALAGIDANNIQSMTVLKDASSTAQYGARGANGVILITTKSGRSGRTEFTINSYYGIQNDATDGPVMLTAKQRLQLFAEGLNNDQPDNYPTVSAAENHILNNVAAYVSWKDAGRPEAQWADVITNKDAPIQEHSFTASSGDEKGTLFASLGYMEQEATVIASDFERITASLNLTRRLSDGIQFSSSNSLAVTEQNGILEQSAYFEGP